MEIKRVIMNNNHEYQLAWDDSLSDGDFIKMIDIQKGWVQLNVKLISEILPTELSNKKINVSGKVRKELIAEYGEQIVAEECI